MPEFRTVGFNQQVQTLRIAEFVGFIERLGVTDGGIGEWHGGGSRVYRTNRPQLSPQKLWKQKILALSIDNPVSL
ncbi:hypothetical protein [Photorhabdus luminescens]|uniref:hypothetical protein n=1 Tax=Photorhabdus luminescens TaxID=29488 RepID=UPI00224056C8|nr:hypothetical protein [Photorhabdus luminescens subsp. venezuelensis]